ncbi:MAG: hypothetical protein FWG68_07725 [Defluviitaleaceae bacterium]|nr:hypothetical protein [Defluviitaleaceae bacterium]
MTKTAERIKFADLYDQFPKKWVVTTNSIIINGAIDTCELHAVYDTEEEALDGIDLAFADGFLRVGIDWMVKGEDLIEPTIIATPLV